MTKAQWRKASRQKWIRMHRRDIAELVAAVIFALILGFITTCHARKIEASFNGLQLKGIYSRNNAFEVMYQNGDQVSSAFFPDREHAEYFAEAIK